MEKLTAFNFLAKLFPHFTNDRSRCLLTHFDSATREGPVFVTWCSVKQYVAGVKDDRGSANLEALTVKID